MPHSVGPCEYLTLLANDRSTTLETRTREKFHGGNFGICCLSVANLSGAAVFTFVQEHPPLRDGGCVEELAAIVLQSQVPPTGPFAPMPPSGTCAVASLLLLGVFPSWCDRDQHEIGLNSRGMKFNRLPSKTYVEYWSPSCWPL